MRKYIDGFYQTVHVGYGLNRLLNLVIRIAALKISVKKFASVITGLTLISGKHK